MMFTKFLLQMAWRRAILVFAAFTAGFLSSSLLTVPRVGEHMINFASGRSASLVREQADPVVTGKPASPSKRPVDKAVQAHGTRKILLDCGGNVASTVQLFRETYPDGKNFLIHSFELDDRLAPYFAPYPNHVLHCPTAVSAKNGNMTAYSETAWSPRKGPNSGRDMQWGGGTLFAFQQEIKDNITGGSRQLSYRRTVPTVDLSRWIRENTKVEDYVILKLDVEGAEYDILRKMLTEGTFKWIDKFYGEYHRWQPVTGWSKEDRNKLAEQVAAKGRAMLDWAGEHRDYEDFDIMHPKVVGGAGKAGVVYSGCAVPADKRPELALVIQVGMNAKAARKLVRAIAAHPGNVRLALFLYGDFVELFPQLVAEWAGTYTIGMRENQPFPLGQFGLQGAQWIRFGLVSAMERHRDAGLQPVYYLAENTTDTVRTVAGNRGLRLIQPTARFPPTVGPTLTVDNYYRYRDVERVPKALRVLSDRLGNTGGILSLDSDHPDSYMISAFLLDYLVENSGFELVSIEKCLTE